MQKEKVNVSDKILKLNQTTNEYKKMIMEQLKGLDFNVKNWNFSVKQNEDEYEVELNLKVGIKSKSGAKTE